MKQRRVRPGNASHGAQRGVHLFRFHQQGVDAREPYRQNSGAVEAGHQLVVDAAGKDFQYGIEGFRGGDAQAAYEAALDAAVGQAAGHLFAAAVDHHQFHAAPASLGQLRGERIARVRRIEQRAAEFDQHPHSSPSVSG